MDRDPVLKFLSLFESSRQQIAKDMFLFHTVDWTLSSFKRWTKFLNEQIIDKREVEFLEILDTYTSDQ